MDRSRPEPGYRDVTMSFTFRIPVDTEDTDLYHEVHAVLYTYLNSDGEDEWRVL